jgi:hypothetical protein
VNWEVVKKTLQSSSRNWFIFLEGREGTLKKQVVLIIVFVHAFSFK